MREEQKKHLELKIQQFAEDAGSEGESAKTENGEATPLTFDEILQDKEYQSAYDKKVAKALENAKAKWQTEYDAKLAAEKTEAEKLAKMNAEQKLSYEKEQVVKERDEYKSKITAYELKDQALTIAKEKNMDVSLLGLLDFTKETAETVNTKIDNIKSVFDKAVENAVNERLKQKTPKQYGTPSTDDDEDPYIKGFRQG